MNWKALLARVFASGVHLVIGTFGGTFGYACGCMCHCNMEQWGPFLIVAGGEGFRTLVIVADELVSQIGK